GEVFGRSVMKFYERVISDFGGYEKCKDILSQPNIDFIMNTQGLREHMLEYRRQHNIFEVGDAMVIPSRGNGIFHFNALFSDRDIAEARHATDAEIKAGKRLEVE